MHTSGVKHWLHILCSGIMMHWKAHYHDPTHWQICKDPLGNLVHQGWPGRAAACRKKQERCGQQHTALGLESSSNKNMAGHVIHHISAAASP
jgi:hypothetical protein